MQATLQEPALVSAVENPGQTLLQAPKAAIGVSRFEKIDFFFGKIKRCLNQCSQFDQLLKQHIDLVREFALQRTNSTARGRCSGRIDEIDYRFGLSQVELSVVIGTAGKFAWLGQSST